MEKEIKEENFSKKDKEFFEAFRMMVHLSIKLGPFSTKEVYYSKEQLEFMYINFKRIVKKI